MVDYRKFLGGSKETVLYLGGSVAYGADAPMRLREPVDVEPGFFRAERSGRFATLAVDEPAERLSCDGEPRAVGHYAAGYVSLEGSRFARVLLLGAPEPEALGKVRVVRHASGVTLFEDALFDEDAEFAAREALLSGRTLAGMRGLSPTLRLAFGWAVCARASTTRGESMSPTEGLGAFAEICEGGAPRAEALLDAIASRRVSAHASRHRTQERNEERAAMSVEEIEGAPPQHALVGTRDRARRGSGAETMLTSRDRSRDVFAYCERALRAARATLEHVRELTQPRRHRRGGESPGTLEVRFRFLGETFICVVDSATLQVHDAGVCLDGADEALTLESLPSAIREAHDTGRLVITRRA